LEVFWYPIVSIDKAAMNFNLAAISKRG